MSAADATAAPTTTTTTAPSATNIVWVDLEMTGLDLQKDRIMEIAVIVTDEQLSPVAAMHDSLVIHVPDDVLGAMDDWCTQHHGASGLTERCRQSTMTVHDAEERVLQFIAEHCVPGTCPLAGNSVYVDRLFLKKEMPRVDKFLHYRIIDVSSFKECIRRWYPQRYAAKPHKKGVHRALDDIRESIEELRYYREHFMAVPEDSER